MKNKPTLRNSTTLATLTLAATVAGIAPKALAADVFTVTAKSPGINSGNEVTKTDGDLEALIRDVVNYHVPFDPFQTVNPFDANLNWGGIPNALKFELSKNTPGAGATVYTGTLTSDVLRGLSVQKSAQSQSQLGDKFVDYFKKDGRGLYSELLKVISETSKVSPIDGNPNAATAKNDSLDFENGAKTTGETKAEKKASTPAGGVPTAFQFDVELGTFKANGISGKTYSLPLAKRFAINERVGLTIGLPVSMSEIGSATVYSGGLNVGVPVSILKKAPEQPVTWRVTPFGGASVTASKDMLLGGAVLRGGISNLMAYDFGKFEVAMGNQISHHNSVEMDIGGIKVDPRVEQQIMKHGFQVCFPIAEHWILEGYAIHTNFLQAAGVRHYFTYGSDIGYRVHDNKAAVKKIVGTLRVGVSFDDGSGYNGAHFRLGSSWKF